MIKGTSALAGARAGCIGAATREAEFLPDDMPFQDIFISSACVTTSFRSSCMNSLALLHRFNM